MSTVCLDTEILTLPPSGCGLEEFRRWALSDESPERAPVFYLAGAEKVSATVLKMINI